MYNVSLFTKSLIRKSFFLLLLILFIRFIFPYCFNFSSQSIVLVRVAGGIGNQLFQYSAAYNFAKKTNSKLYIYIPKEYTSKNNVSSADRFFDLVKLGVNEDQIIYSSTPKDIILSLAMIFNFFYTYDINSKNIKNTYTANKRNIYLVGGFFEALSFFKYSQVSLKEKFNVDKLKTDGTINIAKILQQPNSVCIHARMGDWLKIYGELDNQYYINAINIIKSKVKNPIFYVFSDDVNDAKNKFKNFKSFTYLSDSRFTPLDEFYLLANCKNTINSMSTFVWWASFLNNNSNKIIITPQKYYNNKEVNAPDSWITIKNYKLNNAKYNINTEWNFSDIYKYYI